MNNVQVTIAIPVYNVEKYVEKCLKSALNQDFSGNIEILIVDDCGLDASMDIVRTVVKGHPRGNSVRIVSHNVNKGLGAARNTAIECAKGKYLFFLDSDDWISEDCISVLFERACKDQSDVTIGQVALVNESDGAERLRNHYRNVVYNHSAAGIIPLIETGYRYHIEAWNKLYLCEFLKKNHLKTVHKIIEDSIFDFEVSCLAHRVSLVNKTTLYYLRRENSIMGSLNKKLASDESVKVYCDIINRMQEMIKTKYRNVLGIYDFYYLRLESCLLTLSESVISDSQAVFINKEIKNFNSFVPEKTLTCFEFRVIYALTRSKDDFRDWIRITNYVRKLRYWISSPKRICGKIYRRLLK